MLTRNVVRSVQWAVRILTLGHVAVLLHECAHAIVALWNGSAVTAVVIGKGPLLFRFRHYCTIVEFRERGDAGYILHHDVGRDTSRDFCIYVAGPIASWAWMFLLSFVVPYAWWMAPSLGFAMFILATGCIGDIEGAAFAFDDSRGRVTDEDRLCRSIERGTREQTIDWARSIFDGIAEAFPASELLAQRTPSIAMENAARRAGALAIEPRAARFVRSLAVAARRHKVTWADVHVSVNPSPAASVNAA